MEYRYHFIPFTEEAVGSPDRFESDFMVRYLEALLPLSYSPPLEGLGVVHTSLSQEANAVLAQGKKLWQAYFTQTDVHTVLDELKLNRADVGWYQVRKALQARNTSDDVAPLSFKSFEEAYKSLTEKTATNGI